MNKVILIGNLTKEPEISTTTNGISVCRFTLAVSRRFQNADGEREVDFINIVAWRGLAENVHKYLSKGDKAGVSGTLQTRSYDAPDGTKRYVSEVIADDVEFLVTKGNKEQNTGTKDANKLEPVDDTDLPF